MIKWIKHLLCRHENKILMNKRTVNKVLEDKRVVLYNGELKCEDCGKKISKVLLEEKMPQI